MPTPLFWGFALLGLILAPAALVLMRRPGRKDSPLPGLLLLLALALPSYLACLMIALFYAWGYGVTLLFFLHLPATSAGLYFLLLRYRRYRELSAKAAEEKRKERLPLVASARLRRQLEHFSCDSSLSSEDQRDLIILLGSHGNRQKLASLYNISAEELGYIEDAFQTYRARLERVEAEKAKNKAGVPYTASKEQVAFFLQLMITSTPKSLGCGSTLLWSAEAFRRLMCLSTGIDPNEESVNALMSAAGLVPDADALTATRQRPAVRAWIETEYQKIRLASLEQSRPIFWIQSSKLPDSRRGVVLTALNRDGGFCFSLYKNGGGADFLNKLAQDTGSALFAVILPDALPAFALKNTPGVHLFPVGEPAKIPEDTAATGAFAAVSAGHGRRRP